MGASVTEESGIPVFRGFVADGDRLVHYRMAGKGPPVVLLHDSPRSSVLHLPLLRELADAFTVFALDTPGYGQSDPLPADPPPEIDDFGDALAGALRSLGLDSPVVYAYHTSSKIALSCAIRHPRLIGRVIMDGISLPQDPVPASFIESYMSPFEVDGEGAYLGRQWTKIRDLHRFFPWFRRELAARLPMDAPGPEAMHAYAMDLFMAAGHYSSAYAAAMRYRALEALPRLRTPATFMAREGDVLYAYLDAVEANPPALAEIERLPDDPDVWRARLRELFAAAAGSQRGGERTPADTGRGLRRRYVSLEHGQVHLRESGNGERAAFLLHDPPGSGLDVASLAGRLDGLRVIAPDLPGCGLSDPLDAAAGAGAYGRILLDVADAEGLGEFAIVAQGLAVPLAAALAAARPQRVTSLVLDGMPLLDASQRAAMTRRYAPPIAPTRDGSHFLATWHRLRDEEMQFPWYDGSRQAARRVEPELDAQRLHDRLVATLLQPGHYGDACRAALGCDLAGLANGLEMPVLAFEAVGDPRYAGVRRWCGGLPIGRCVARPGTIDARAELVRSFLEASS